MEAAVEVFEVEFEEKSAEKRTLLSGNEFREHSRDEPLCQNNRTRRPKGNQATIETKTAATAAEEWYILQGRSLKLLLAAKDIPDFQFDAAEPDEEGESSERTDVMEIMDVDTKESAPIQQNSDSWEHSRNLLESAAGGASDQVNQQRSLGKTMDPELHSGTSEYRELPQKSWSSKKSGRWGNVKKTCAPNIE